MPACLRCVQNKLTQLLVCGRATYIQTLEIFAEMHMASLMLVRFRRELIISGKTMKIRLALRTSKRRASNGFTLLECFVASVIVLLGMLSLYAGITYGFSVTEVTRENLRATQLILEKFETIRLYTWDQINGVNGFVIPTNFTESYVVDATGTASGVIYNGTMTIAPAPLGASYSGDMKLVTVTLNWTSAGMPRSRTMQTLVARQGLQQYVY